MQLSIEQKTTDETKLPSRHREMKSNQRTKASLQSKDRPAQASWSYAFGPGWFRHSILLSITLLAISCGGGGMSGCSEEPSPPFIPTVQNTVDQSVKAGLTGAGAEYLYQRREAILGAFLDVDESGWLLIPVGEYELTSSGQGMTVTDLVLGVDLPSAQLDVAFLSNPTRVRLELSNARVRFDEGFVTGGLLFGDSVCELSNGIESNLDGGVAAVTNLEVDVILDINSQRRLSIDVDLKRLDLVNLDVEVSPAINHPACQGSTARTDCESRCNLASAVADLGELFEAAFSDEISTVVEDAIEELVAEELAELLVDPIGLEARIASRNLRPDIPVPADGYPVDIYAGPSTEGFSLLDEGRERMGLALGLDTGFASQRHPCVPPSTFTPTFEAGPTPILSGYGPDGTEYHVAFALAEAAINFGFWQFWQAGMLCINLDSEILQSLTEQRIDSTTLGVFLPSLSALTDPESPIMIALQPNFDSQGFPLLTLQNIDDSDGVPQLGLNANLTGAIIDIYGQIDGRYSRVIGIETAAKLKFAIQAMPGNALLLTSMAPEVEIVGQTYNEILQSDGVSELLRLALDVVLASVLQDGLSFDLGLEDAISMATGIPINVKITDLELGGIQQDHLTVKLLLSDSAAEQMLLRSVETVAAVASISSEHVDVSVDAIGSEQAFYQWRLEGGPWRPLVSAEHGVIRIKEPRLRVPGTHRVEIRAVDKANYETLDPTPAEVFIVVPMPLTIGTDNPVLPPTKTSGRITTVSSHGCSVQATSAIPSWLVILIPIIFAVRRRLRLSSLLFFFLFINAGCNDRDPAPDIPCVDSRDCPGGFRCVDSICRQRVPCQGSESCCADQICVDNQCKQAPGDDCSEAQCPENQHCVDNVCRRKQCNLDMPCENGLRCLEGWCIQGTPCGGSCMAEQACYVHRDLCRSPPSNCANLQCTAFETLVVKEPEFYEGPVCDLESAQCACVQSADDGAQPVLRQGRMALVNGSPVFTAYEVRRKSLVFVEGAEDELPKVYFLDGPENEIGIQGSELEAIDRGQNPDLVTDIQGRVHVVYSDFTKGDLRYIRRDVGGLWTRPIIVDSEGNVGAHPRVQADALGQPHIVYTVTLAPDSSSGLRYAVGAAQAFEAQDFQFQNISFRPLATTAVGTTTVHGKRPCLDLGEDGLIRVGFFDESEHWLYVAVGGVSGFQVNRMDGVFQGEPPTPAYVDFNNAKLGEFCAIHALGGDTMLVFPNADTGDVMSYRGRVDGLGIYDIVDQGASGGRRFMGASPQIEQDTTGRLWAVYQDSTFNSVRMNSYDGFSWRTDGLQVSDDGALGFTNSLSLIGNQAIVGTVEMRTAGRGIDTSRLRVFRFDLP